MTRSAIDDLADIFPGESEMSRLMRAHDWSATPLGNPHHWPDGLKIPLRMLLTSRFEMWLGWGPELQFFYNDAYIPTLGIKHPTMLGRPFREVWAEVYDEVADQVELVKAGEATWNKALPLLLERSGYPEETYHSFSYSPLHAKNGSVAGMLCIVTEETERVISERRLGTLRMLGMELIEASDQDAVRAAACSVFNANRYDFPFVLIHFSNGGAIQGHSCTEDAGHLLDHEWPIDPAAVGDGITIKLPEGVQYPTGAWDRPPFEGVIVPIPGATNEPVQGTMLFGLNPYRRRDEDVTDLARLIAGQVSGTLANVAALASEKRRADLIWSYSRDLMLVIEKDGTLRSVSPAWTRILGHRLSDVIGHNLQEFVFEEDLPSTLRALDQARSGVELSNFENRYWTVDDQLRWISWHTAMEHGRVYAYGRDITQQKAHAEMLAATEEALRQSQKMEAVGQLTGGIAHDFNNLLQGIVGSLEMMQRRAAQGRVADVERYASAATASANRAAAVTQRLLAFSRRQPLDPKVLDANELARGLEELIRRSIGETIEFNLIADEALWKTKCDANQLENAVLNLAINARDAMPGGGRLVIETRNVTIDGSEAARTLFVTQGDYVEIAVRDTGCGMSPETAAKAFDPFFTTKPMGRGTGLGLSMIYGFARQSGGSTVIESKEDDGTTVRLLLPRSSEASPPDHQPGSHATDTQTAISGTVLIVEDESAVRMLVIDALEELGYRTLQAVDGPSGLEILRSTASIDLMISDVGLPGLNGKQLADAGQALRPGLKVLFITGYAHNAAPDSNLLDPGMQLITKPFTIEMLAARVKTMIGTP